jgi:hypothetical protein
MSSEHHLPGGLPRPPSGDLWTVDGLEDTPHGRAARLELPDGQTVVVPLGTFPEDVGEGDLLDVTGGPDGLHARRLPELTRARREAAQARLDTLNGPENAADDGGTGEITL